MVSNGTAVTRRTVIIGASVLTTGCVDTESSEGQDATDGENESGEAPSGNESPATGEIKQRGDLTLTSPAFEDGERIPEKYGHEADNVNPPLAIENVPDGAEALALIMDDPDALEPAGEVWHHWIVWDIPPETTSIPEDWNPSDATVGTNDYGNVGYDGPNPPDSEHRYRFKLFALDTRLELPPETTAEGLGAAMDRHVLEQTQLEGTYPA